MIVFFVFISPFKKRYGTFAVNEPRERAELGVDQSTRPVWDHFLDYSNNGAVKNEFVNPLFDPSMVSICLWDSQVFFVSLSCSVFFFFLLFLLSLPGVRCGSSATAGRATCIVRSSSRPRCRCERASRR